MSSYPERGRKEEGKFWKGPVVAGLRRWVPQRPQPRSRLAGTGLKIAGEQEGRGVRDRSPAPHSLPATPSSECSSNPLCCVLPPHIHPLTL
ncbi:hypothetical protein SKAU_G00101270 [Synaphobranchus kaupii]|uniref:Uncharacterized protein n=1 Tax=Synaphobranchus kaupii TaxID=118154 RepID=A0A9Q1J751_SYNKA|nr:hypothetical protein SKAU_G00101270 [Synaphobranchus kaupii]